jgi:hypothetical protein
MRSARGFLAGSLLALIVAGCYSPTSPMGAGGLWRSDGTTLAYDTDGPSALVDPLHVTQGRASTAEDRFGLRFMMGWQQNNNAETNTLDPIEEDAAGNPQGYEKMTGNVFDRLLDFHYPVAWVDINYTSELDENLWLEIFAGSIVVNDESLGLHGIRVPVDPNNLETLPPSRDELEKYNLTITNDFLVIGASALVRLGTGRYALPLPPTFFGIGGNIYFTNTPNYEESAGLALMMRMAPEALSSETMSLSIDAKYWFMESYGDQEYLFLGANFNWRF